MLRSILKQSIIPKLSPELHKGQAGKIAVVGGCEHYTGAPYFAAMAALRGGGDLSTVICEPSAAIPIKSYSPDIMVSGCLEAGRENDIREILQKVDVVVIGPGLGRAKHTMDITTKVVQILIDLQKQSEYSKPAIIMDGDGLWLLQKNPMLLNNCPNPATIVLTPNAMEFRRLWASLFGFPSDVPPLDIHIDSGPEIEYLLPDKSGFFGNPSVEHTRKLAAEFGNVLIVRKGYFDIVSDGKDAAICRTDGAPRRCGGQGDILAGLTGLFISWTSKSCSFSNENFLAACIGASIVTRVSARLAFQAKSRGAITSDMLDVIPTALDLLVKE